MIAKAKSPHMSAQVKITLLLLGLASLPTYLYAWRLQDLRAHTIGFLIAFFTAFLLYGIAVAIALRTKTLPGRGFLLGVSGVALLYGILLIGTPPTLSDDMYRYVWDGRVQAAGISPYRYPPEAPELAYLRDQAVYPFINRKSAVTVYPPAAEFVYAFLWRIAPDSVRWFQVAVAGAALLAGVLLVGLLRDLDRQPARVLIYLWSPLLLYETAHAAHLDGLILPLLVGAMWARQRERDGWVGISLGFAAAMKFFPALLLPALWRPKHPQGRWRMPLGFGAALLAGYLPYLIRSGAGVIGFLPGYVRERFNVAPPLMWYLRNSPFDRFSDAQLVLLFFTLIVLGLVSLGMVLRPADSAEAALRRCIWPIGILTLLNPNLFSWYLLWLLPFLAIFLEPGVIRWRERRLTFGLRLNAWTGWWLFSGLVGLSYTFFLEWTPVPVAIHAQFWPLYLFLAIDLARRLAERFPRTRFKPLGERNIQ